MLIVSESFCGLAFQKMVIGCFPGVDVDDLLGVGGHFHGTYYSRSCKP